MAEGNEKNNLVYLSGRIVGEPAFSHELYGEKFYEFRLRVMRFSGQADIIPVTMSERLMGPGVRDGAAVSLSGQFRSFNKPENGRSRLCLTAFVRETDDAVTEENRNVVAIAGYLCRKPVYRKTPAEKEIADLLIAVNRSYNKSDYIPTITWGRNARFANDLSVGDRVAVCGRIQSREYQKKLGDGSYAVMTAYEVSASRIVTFGEDTVFDIEKEFGLAGLRGGNDGGAEEDR